jgi:hypothetical protein
MAIRMDSKLITELENDPLILKLSASLNKDNRFFKKAWVIYQSEKWFPVLVEEQKTKVLGFDFNPSGDWGKNETVGRKKIPLVDLLAYVISRSYPNKSSIRCKTKSDGDSNARHFKDLKFDPELEKLITDYRKRFELSGQKIETGTPLVIHTETDSTLSPFSAEDTKSIDDEAKSIDVLVKGFDGEEGNIIVKYRLNQGKFRKILLDYWNSSCAVSGLNDERLLIASHILPWSKSTNNQKGDPFNGLLLSVVWDSLFDKGLISFDDEGKAILERLTVDVIYCLGLKTDQQVIDAKKLTNEHKQYLKMHRLLHQFE